MGYVKSSAINPPDSLDVKVKSQDVENHCWPSQNLCSSDGRVEKLEASEPAKGQTGHCKVFSF